LQTVTPDLYVVPRGRDAEAGADVQRPRRIGRVTVRPSPRQARVEAAQLESRMHLERIAERLRGGRTRRPSGLDRRKRRRSSSSIVALILLAFVAAPVLALALKRAFLSAKSSAELRKVSA